jgi:hypothetical protein
MSDSDKEDKNIKALRAAIKGIQNLEMKLQTTKLLFDWFVSKYPSIEISQKMGFEEVTETIDLIDKLNPIVESILQCFQANSNDVNVNIAYTDDVNVDAADALLQLKDDNVRKEDESDAKATTYKDEENPNDEATKKREKATKARQECRKKQKMRIEAEESFTKNLVQKTDLTMSGPFVTSFDTESYVSELSDARGDAEKIKVYQNISNRVNKSVYVHRMLRKFGVNKRNTDIESMKPEPIDKWIIDLHLKDYEKPDDDVMIFPWFVVKQSTLRDAGLGVFAARKFCKGECIGIYMGPILGNRQNSVYSIAASFGVCDPGRGYKSSNPRPYYGMGIHIINDPAWTMDKLLGRQNNKNKWSNSKSSNVCITQDMLVHALKDILPNQELFLDYNYNMENKQEQDQKTEGSLKRKRSSKRILERNEVHEV